MKQLFRNWRNEILAAIALAIGLFLLVENFGVRRTLGNFGRSLFGQLSQGLQQAIRGILGWAHPAKVTIAMALIVGAVLLLQRVRRRILQSATLTGRHCPKCNGPLRKQRRHVVGRLVSAIVPLRPYHCKSCGWEGWRARERERSSHHRR